MLAYCPTCSDLPASLFCIFGRLYKTERHWKAALISLVSKKGTKAVRLYNFTKLSFSVTQYNSPRTTEPGGAE